MDSGRQKVDTGRTSEKGLQYHTIIKNVTSTKNNRQQPYFGPIVCVLQEKKLFKKSFPMVAPDIHPMMHGQEKEMANKSGDPRKGGLQRVSTNDEALLLLKDRQQAATSLNNLLQNAMGDSRIADSYQAFRIRYLRALGKFRPVEYEESEELMDGDKEAIRIYLRKLRSDEREKKEHCSQLQNAWLLYDTLATDKPEVLSAEEQQIEEEMDEFEEELFEEWHDFAEEVIARAEFEGEEDQDIGEWHLELKEIRKDLKLIKRRKDERNETRKKALERVRDMVRARRGEEIPEKVDEDEDSSENKKSRIPTKLAKSSKSKRSKHSEKLEDDDSSEEGLNGKSTHTAHSSKRKKQKDKKSSKKSSKKKDNSKKMLEEVFPPHIAKALREGRKVQPESKECVTIFFSDIVGFSNISASLSPLKISDMLDRLYQKFDALSHYHDVFKVETIGDSWMGVTNLVKYQPDHVQRVARFALDAVKASQQTWVDEEDHSLGRLNLRVGFHSGPVVANVVGSRSPRYCLFGDTVNTASRMESHSLPGMIHCSDVSANILRKDEGGLFLYARGKIEVRGKGPMETFFVRDEAAPEEPQPATVLTHSPQRVSKVFRKDSSQTNAHRPIRQKSISMPEVDIQGLYGSEHRHDRSKRRPRK